MTEIRRNSVTSFVPNVQSRLKKMANKVGYASHIHELRLKGKQPLHLLGTPSDPWAGSVAAGSHILSGRFYYQGKTLRNPEHNKGEWQGGEAWQAKNLDSRWQPYLHSFSWLRDLNRGVDRQAARRRGIMLTRNWLQDFDHCHDLAWAPDITGQRIINWMAYAPLILDTSDLKYRGKLLNCLARQARHLYHTCDDPLRGVARLQAICGLMMAGLYVPDGENWFKKATGLLKRALATEILADGGMASRSPEDLHKALRVLLVVRASHRAMGRNKPEILDDVIRRMTVKMKTLLHGDGKLALFNGSNELTAAEIAATLSFAADNKDKTPAPGGEKSGFRRLHNGDMVVIIDAGPPADLEVSQKNHAGTLSFEMSIDQQRVIVNCGGANTLALAEFNPLSRTSAAHSTLVLANINSSEIRKDGLIGQGPTVVRSTQTCARGHGLLETSHDGYLSQFGIIHHRAIYINDLGDDMRGEDVLECRTVSAPALKYDVRFHLHPDITVPRQEAADRLLLRLPNGEYWQFQFSGGRLSMEESIYFGGGERMQNGRQIVVSGATKTKKTVIKWSLRRIENNN